MQFQVVDDVHAVATDRLCYEIHTHITRDISSLRPYPASQQKAHDQASSDVACRPSMYGPALLLLPLADTGNAPMTSTLTGVTAKIQTGCNRRSLDGNQLTGTLPAWPSMLPKLATL
jgi:hypothetical protein